MTTQQVISNMAAWLTEHTADLTYKRASLYEQAQAEDYAYTLVRPAIYELQLPINAAEHDKDAEDAPITAPCVIVCSGGESTMSSKDGETTTSILLKLFTWNPGQHTMTEDGERAFTPDGEGWRDCTSFLDTVAKRMLNEELPAGCSMTGDITVSLPDVEDNPYYPYYFGTIQFDLVHYRRERTKFDI